MTYIITLFAEYKEGCGPVPGCATPAEELAALAKHMAERASDHGDFKVTVSEVAEGAVIAQRGAQS